MLRTVEAIVEADDTATIFSEVPDIARQMDWPGAVGRAIRNPLIEAWHGREPDLLGPEGEEIGRRLEQGKLEGRREDGLFLAGEVSGLIHDVRPAGQVVREIVAEAERVMQERAALFS